MSLLSVNNEINLLRSNQSEGGEPFLQQSKIVRGALPVDQKTIHIEFTNAPEVVNKGVNGKQLDGKCSNNKRDADQCTFKIRTVL